MKNVVRYHAALVALHWLVAALVLVGLVLGLYAATSATTDPHKTGVLRLHMIVGVLIGSLTLLRMLVRAKTARPPAATTGSRRLDAVAKVTHVLLYALLLLLTGTGLATATASGLNLIVFGNSGAPVPTNLAIYPSFVAHEVLAILLGTSISLHVLAALYHHVLKKDGLLGRMWLSPGAPRAAVLDVPTARRG